MSMEFSGERVRERKEEKENRQEADVVNVFRFGEKRG